LERVGVQAKHEYNGGKKERKKERRKRKKFGRKTKWRSKDANGPSVALEYHVIHKRENLRYQDNSAEMTSDDDITRGTSEHYPCNALY
jgi:hypothetical protein